jgi:hypothetical protein
MSHAQRFDAVGAQKGTALHKVVETLKDVADAIEDHYDANSPEVVGAMQRFEQGLALIRTAPERAAESEDDGEQQAESGSPKPTTRRKTAKNQEKEGEES